MNPLSLLHLPDLIRSQLRSILLGFVTAICILAGVGFLLAALWLWLATQTQPLVASLIIGVTLILLSASAFMITRKHDKSEPEREHEREREHETETEPDAKLSLKTIANLEAGKGDAVSVLVDAFVLGASTYRDIRSGR